MNLPQLLFEGGKKFAYEHNAWYPLNALIVKMASCCRATVKKSVSNIVAVTRYQTIILGGVIIEMLVM